MDANTNPNPNPKPSNPFPLVSYVMSRLHPSFKFSSPSPDPPDLENPSLSSATANTASDEVELVERMPGLDDPALLASMASAVSEIAQARSVLRTLGDRPDHEAVDDARARVAAIDAAFASDGLDEIVAVDDPGLAEREREARGRAEQERAACLAVVSLDEMHEAYEKLLREAEDRLVKMYDGRGDGGDQEVTEENEKVTEEDEKVKEEVIGILQEASTKSLEKVDLSDRRLRVLPEAFGMVRGLVYLNLSNNLLEVIPDAIAGLDCLEELRLASNVLVTLPDSIGLLSKLKILDVSGNKLKALPDSISKCRSLVELNASYNELTYLPTNIGFELQHLEKLWIHLNKIRSLPTSICEMRSLRLLDAHFNELHGLPYAFGKLTNLETLNLSSNFSDMQELPATFGDLFNLRELDVSNNQIHVLPDSFGRLENLTKLNLDQNPIVIPPADVVNDGVAAVKEYMTKRLVDILLEEKRKSMAAEDSPKTPTAWLTRSTSWLNNWVSGVSGYLGGGEKSNKDPYLNQEL